MSLSVLALASYSDRAEAATFIGLRDIGIDVEVMCEPESSGYDRYVSAGLPTTPLSIRRPYELSAIRAIRSALERNRHDVLHLLTRRTLRNALVAAWGLDVRLVAYRGVAGATRLRDPANWITFLHPWVDRIICVSELVRRDLLEQQWLGFSIAPEKVVTIHKGHDVDWYANPPADLSALGVPADAFVVGCLTNLRPGKGIEYLIDAAGHLEPGEDVHFLLVGRGMDGPEVATRIARSPASSRFHVRGYRKDGPEIMAACDTMVLPSLSEGLSKVVIEAMAYRTPPVVTATGGGEIVEHGVSGLVVPDADAAAIARAIRRLLHDPSGRERMGEAARRRIARDFSIDDTIRRTKTLYEEITSSPA